MKLLIEFDQLSQHAKITCDIPITATQTILLLETVKTQVLVNLLNQKEDRRVLSPN